MYIRAIVKRINIYAALFGACHTKKAAYIFILLHSSFAHIILFVLDIFFLLLYNKKAKESEGFS